MHVYLVQSFRLWRRFGVFFPLRDRLLRIIFSEHLAEMHIVNHAHTDTGGLVSSCHANVVDVLVIRDISTLLREVTLLYDMCGGGQRERFC